MGSVPLRSDWSQRRCPIARSLDVVGDPWVLLIIREAMLGTRRFDQFRETLQVADNVLSRRLQAMVQAGLLTREPYQDGNRTRHEYLLTPAGEDLLPVLHGLVLWGEKHRSLGADAGALGIVHRACGTMSTSPDRCSGCGEQLTPDSVDWERPWRDPVRTALVPATDPRVQMDPHTPRDPHTAQEAPA